MATTKAYKRAIALSPNDPEVIIGYAYYLLDKDAGAAVKMFEPLLALEPRDANFRLIYAGLLDSNGEVDAALASTEKRFASIDLCPCVLFGASTLWGMVWSRRSCAATDAACGNTGPSNQIKFSICRVCLLNWERPASRERTILAPAGREAASCRLSMLELRGTRRVPRGTTLVSRLAGGRADDLGALSHYTGYAEPRRTTRRAPDIRGRA